MNDINKPQIIIECLILFIWIMIGSIALITGSTDKVTYGCLLLMYVVKSIQFIIEKIIE